MRKKISNSLSTKVFLWVFTALTLCSVLIYGIVLVFVPQSYQLTGSKQFENNVGALFSALENKSCEEGVSAELDAGKMYAILGPSGCGKTTLLSLLGGLDSPLEGQILFDGQDIEITGLAAHRKNNAAFIFQSYNLIDYLTPKENVALTSKLPPQPILERVGLTEEESKRNVLKLSGGQQQRVAIARALASDAKVILADEPTGNLDEDTAAEITKILKECAHQMNKCVVIVTHSNELAKQADVILKLRKGELQIVDTPDTDTRKGRKNL